MSDKVKGIFGLFKPVLDESAGTFTENQVVGVFGQFQPVIDPEQAAGGVITQTKDNSVKANIAPATITNNNDAKANLVATNENENSVKANLEKTQSQENSSKANIKTTYYSGMTYDWKPSYEQGQNRGYQE